MYIEIDDNLFLLGLSVILIIFVFLLFIFV